MWVQLTFALTFFKGFYSNLQNVIIANEKYKRKLEGFFIDGAVTTGVNCTSNAHLPWWNSVFGLMQNKQGKLAVA